jgi:O-antigen/teichoic acid export membrane protein
LSQTNSQFLRGLLTLTLSRYFVRGLSLVKGLVVARVLGPNLYGVMGLLAVFLGYSAYADLGIFGGLTKEVPVHLARKEESKAREAEGAGFTAVTAFTLVFALVVLVALWGRTPDMTRALPALAFAMAAQQGFKYCTVLLRSRSLFSETALAWSVLQILDMGLELALVFPLHLTGVFLGQGLAFLIASIFVVTRYHLIPRIHVNIRLSGSLVAAGIPLVVSTLTFLLLQTVDRFLIAGYLDTTALGHYMIGVFCANLIYFIPQSLGYVLFPNFRERLATLADGERPPVRYIELPTRMLSYVLPPFTAAVFLGIPVIGLLLPAYVPGLGSARILVMGTFFLSLVTSITSFLIAADRHRQLMLVQAGAVILDLVLNILALKTGRGIEGVAMATAVSYLFYGSASLWLAYRYLRFPNFRVPPRLSRLYVPFLYVLVAALLVATWSPLGKGSVLLTVILREALFLVALLPGIWFLQRTTGAVGEVAEMIRKAVKA